MKKIILIAFVLYSGIAFSNKVTIINSGFVFSPDSVSINFGDTLIFQLGGTHNAVEVSQTTWNSNGTTMLPGGFTTPFTGGQITGLTPGYHYYVCTNHAFMGMKGKIFVISNSSINSNKYNNLISVFPNPTNGKISVKTNVNLLNSNYNLTLYNTLGEKINFYMFNDNEIDLTECKKGIYLLKIISENKIYTTKIILN